MPIVTAALSGVLFGVGLALSGMVNPEKVIGFLDIAGVWDPSLMFVMLGGIGVNGIGWYLLKQTKPLFASTFYLPSNHAIDKKLILGSAVFGIGWGIAGLCPGPVIANIFIAPQLMLPFLLCMLLGLFIGSRMAQLKIAS